MRNQIQHSFAAVRTIILTAVIYFCAAAPAVVFGAPAANDSTISGHHESIFGDKTKPLALSHFTWGAEVGSSIDLTGHDLSTFNLDAILGYKNSYIKCAGIGVGVHRTVKSGNNFIPVYALFRSSFRKKPSLVFMNALFGYSFNTVDNSPTFGDFCAALGCGFNLSTSRMAKSYLIFNLGYRYFNQRHKEMLESIDTHYVFVAQISFGVNF